MTFYEAVIHIFHIIHAQKITTFNRENKQVHAMCVKTFLMTSKNAQFEQRRSASHTLVTKVRNGIT